MEIFHVFDKRTFEGESCGAKLAVKRHIWLVTSYFSFSFAFKVTLITLESFYTDILTSGMCFERLVLNFWQLSHEWRLSALWWTLFTEQPCEEGELLLSWQQCFLSTACTYTGFVISNFHSSFEFFHKCRRQISVQPNALIVYGFFDENFD